MNDERRIYKRIIPFGSSRPGMRLLHDLMAAVLLALVVTPAHAQEDAPVGAPSFQEGDD